MSTETLAHEEVRTPEGGIVAVSTTRTEGSKGWITTVDPGNQQVGDYGHYGPFADAETAFARHRAICRAVRLGHPVSKKLAE
ncbi:hypothetical protein ACFVGM_09050 [Kitasatospora purpeofusca]|uniref:hypothetical protein n=1 Tax=Kitasatospora purpeofusca TaxID=67352 RepID=UPI00368E58B5